MADVGATLVSWSSTTASNSPAGSTSIGTGLDDNLREMQGVVVRGLSHKGVDIASAGGGTTDIGAVEGLMHDITGTNAITSLGTVRAGILKILKFEGVLTLTHNATSLILPGAANIATANGDIGIFISEGSGNWRCVSYFKSAARPNAGITLGTELATTSGTEKDFTIPSGVKRMKVMWDEVSLNGTANLVIQLGDAGGIETSGYLASITTDGGSVAATNYFQVVGGSAATDTCSGILVLDLMDGSNTWVGSGISSRNGGVTYMYAGRKATSAELTTVRFTTTNGTDALDAGSVNVSYEF